MRITIFGLGYVGCVTAACLANQGHDVTGVDVDGAKVASINAGLSPIIETGVEELIRNGVRNGTLRATHSVESIGDIAMICVGTPGRENGSLDVTQVSAVVADIGRMLGKSAHYSVVVVRSTVLPGTVEQLIIPLLEQHSGKACGSGYGVVMNPEFMRESTAVRDFHEPPFTVIGALDKLTANRVGEIYSKLECSIERTTIREAEMIKYACNAFHAMKVCFANEIGNLSKSLGIDSHRVMQILCRDQKLNISPYYLKPGFAFGGSCLPKDLNAMLYQAGRLDVEVPLLRSLRKSNRQQIAAAYNFVRRTGKTKIGVLGLSFKTGTDDLRESPIVTLIEMLIGKGLSVSIFDEEVTMSRIHGANRRYIDRAIPHLATFIRPSISEVVSVSELLVVSKNGQGYAKAIEELSPEQGVLDLVRLSPQPNGRVENYEGICW